MKKFLFTLATLIAAGLTVSAGNVVLSLSQNEITMAPGERVEVTMSLDEIDAIVTGVQFQYTMTDPEGNPIPRSGDVYLNVSGGQWMTPIGPSLFPGAALSCSTPRDGVYKSLGANVSYNIYWCTEPYVWQDPEDPDADPEEIWDGCDIPAGVFKFTVRTRANWDQEYAVLTLDESDSKIMFQDASFVRPSSQALSIVIKNSAFVVEDKDLTGEIVFGEMDENGNVPVSYNGPEEVTLTVTVDGVEVEITDGMFNLGTYGEHEVVVTAAAEGYKSESRTMIFTWTEPVPEVTETPVINYNEETMTITVEGEGEIHCYVNGEEVELPYTFEQGDEAVTYTVTATAQEAGELISETATREIIVPAKPAPEVTATPEVNFEMRGEVLWCVITGEGDIFVDGVNYGPAPVEFVVTTQTEQDQEGYYMVYAIADGKTQSEIVSASWTCPAKVVEPEVTAAPELVITETEDAIVIDAVGEGEIHVYVNGEEVEIPCTIAKGETEQTIVVTATAQGEGKEISEVVEKTVVVPAKAETPEDPHMMGAWIVILDENGNECWFEMSYDADDDNWYLMKTLHHQPWPLNAPFYFMVNGVRYGAEADMTLPQMGDASQTILNNVYETENYFYVPAGYTYTWGLQFIDGEIYLLVAQGKMTDVEEINAGKAVASVRYFNMAGQEMQEANGICIAVTTYTDGTTSAVKVMK